MPTSYANRRLASQQRLENPPSEREREWFPLWLAGPVVALVAMLGLIGAVMLLAKLYTRIF